VSIDIDTKTHTVTRAEPLERMAKEFEEYKLNFLTYSAIEISYYLKECNIALSWYDINDTINRNTDRNKLLQNNNPYLKNHNTDHNKTVTKKTNFYTKDELKDYFGNKKDVVISHFCYGNVTLNVTVSSPYKNASFKYCNIVTNETETPDIELKVSMPSCYDVTPALNEKIKDAIQIIKENPEENYELVLNKFGQIFIDKSIEQGIFTETILGRKLEFLEV